jgi:ubiquinone/menaquinone biosynthesis C-methylase UbiE
VSFEFEARFFRELLSESGVTPRRVLVVGCGAGVEVAHIASATGATVVGVDLDVDPNARSGATALARADARRLPFRDGAFDAVYCYHVLEHVPGPESAVREAHRVLAPRGVGYFGTPNKSRIVGYLGGRATTWEKVTWNATDWWQRLTGRWSNAQGAHAGFTDRELLRLLGAEFARVESVSLPYYLGKYPRLAGLWRTSYRLGFARFLAPSVYARVGGG